jgi:glyoxylase-like metal-dependent hydrolase (beta-lactamase superfamily II)
MYHIIKPGKVVKDGERILFASSSVTLILDEFPLIVDTALRSEWNEIEKGLRNANVSAGDIEMVVNTHLHADHTGCNGMFRCQKFAHPLAIKYAGAKGYKECPKRISKNVRIMDTPGHCLGHIAVVYEGDETVVIAGDAIPTRDNYIKRLPPRIHVDREAAMRSFAEIEKIADVIVPGHDEVIRTHFR